MRLVILGAGGYGRTIMDVASQSGKYSEIFFLDDKAERKDVIGRLRDFTKFEGDDTEFYPAIGNNSVRCEWIERLSDAGARVASIVHTSAYVSPTVKIGIGVAVLPGAIVGTNSVIGDGTIINCGAIVDHDVVLGKGVHVAPGAIVKGENVIEDMSKVESGTVIETGELKGIGK